MNVLHTIRSFKELSDYIEAGRVFKTTGHRRRPLTGGWSSIQAQDVGGAISVGYTSNAPADKARDYAHALVYPDDTYWLRMNHYYGPDGTLRSETSVTSHIIRSLGLGHVCRIDRRSHILSRDGVWHLMGPDTRIRLSDSAATQKVVAHDIKRVARNPERTAHWRKQLREVRKALPAASAIILADTDLGRLSCRQGGNAPDLIEAVYDMDLDYLAHTAGSYLHIRMTVLWGYDKWDKIDAPYIEETRGRDTFRTYSETPARHINKGLSRACAALGDSLRLALGTLELVKPPVPFEIVDQ